MCGIVGVLREQAIDAPTLARMRDALAHRGPDDAGAWISDDRRVGLGQRRLAIIDLSPAGNQPMPNEDGTVQMVYNGEVYNYADLQRRLEQRGHRFRSHSDSETIIHAYEEWGTTCLASLRGMFAFGLWDARRARLMLARDHTGIKPMFYYWDGTTFAFASEIKAFWALGGLDRSIDRSAIFDYLTYLYIPAPKTAYQRIRKLEPGHYLVFDGTTITIKPYWDVSLEQDDGLDAATATRLVQQHLRDAVALNMVSDVPVGVFLSGGLDSSTVVAQMARQSSTPPRTFSIGFDLDQYSETSHARVVAEAFGTQHHEQTVGRESLRALLGRMVQLYDEPYCDSSSIPTLAVSALARQHVKVALSGDGGDEVFAGYTRYSNWLLQQRINDRVPRAVRQGISASATQLWPPQARGARMRHFLEGLPHDGVEQYARQLELFTPQEKRQVLGAGWAGEFQDYDDYWYFRRYWRTDVDPLTRVQYLDLKTYLPDDILTKVDRASMAVGLETRPPLLDHHLVELLFRIPAALRFRNGTKKHLLKQAMQGVLPETILSRPKQGFGIPLMEWMDDEREWAKDTLRASDGLIHPDVVEGMSRYLWGPKCWALLVLIEWFRQEQAA